MQGSRRLTVSEENDGLGLGVVLGLRHVGLETANGLDAAGRIAGVDHAAETAGPHSHVFRHARPFSSAFRRWPPLFVILEL